MSKMARKRLPPVDGTTRELYLYSGNQCAFEGCAEVLLKENGTWNCEVAHICGVKPGSARGDHDLSNEELRDSSNLVLMCPNHHTEIDNKDLESIYTIEKIRKLKKDHEARYRNALVGLERIVDSTAGVSVKRPKNLGALDGFCADLTNEEIRETVELAAPFVDALVKQPAALRDVIALILVHGKVENFWGSNRVLATITKIEAVASSVTDHEIKRRAEALVFDDLLEIDEDEGEWFFILKDPTSRSNGWDLFVEIHELAGGRSEVIRRIIDNLDFTVMDAR